VSAPISPMVAELITASLSMTHDATNSLVDSLTEQLAESQASEAAIRAGVLGLLDGPYMPTPAAIERALYPSRALVAHFRTEVTS
jgi:hypothetical protein